MVVVCIHYSVCANDLPCICNGGPSQRVSWILGSWASCTQYSMGMNLPNFFQFEVWITESMNALDTCCGNPWGRDKIPKIELRGLKPFLFVDGHYNRTTYDISFLSLLFLYCRTHVIFHSMFPATQRNFIILFSCFLSIESMFRGSAPPILRSIVPIHFNLGSCPGMSLHAWILGSRTRIAVHAK